MLKRPITYTDFNGDKQTEDFYFNLSLAEVIELEMNTEEGLQEWLKKIIATNDRANLFATFKKIILSAYGEKSPDGKSFVKNPTMVEAFSQTAAFHTLLVELATNDGAAADFILGALPKEMAEKVRETQPQDKPASVPTPFKLPPQPPQPPTPI